MFFTIKPFGTQCTRSLRAGSTVRRPRYCTGTFAFYRVNCLFLLARTSNGQIRGPLLHFLSPYSSARPHRSIFPTNLHIRIHGNVILYFPSRLRLSGHARSRFYSLALSTTNLPRPNRTIGEPRDLPRFVYDRAHEVLFETTITGEKLKLTFRVASSRDY